MKVLDFGIAKIVAEGATSGATTQSIGTPTYMAPEQFNPAAGLTGAADLYALAMVSYTLLVGAAYWRKETKGGNIFALATVAMRGPSEPASVRAAAQGVSLPPAFDAWFAQATAVDPARRFPSGLEMVNALALALGVPEPAPAARGPEPSRVGLTQMTPVYGSAPMPSGSHAQMAAGYVLAPPPAAVPQPPSIAPPTTGAALSASRPVPRRDRRGPVLVAGVATAAAAVLVMGILVWVAPRPRVDGRPAPRRPRARRRIPWRARPRPCSPPPSRGRPPRRRPPRRHRRRSPRPPPRPPTRRAPPAPPPPPPHPRRRRRSTPATDLR